LHLKTSSGGCTAGPTPRHFAGAACFRMAHFLALIFIALAVCGQAKLRLEADRKAVGECANTPDEVSFTAGEFTETFPSKEVKQAETVVQDADLISIKYGSTFKVLQENFAKEMYILMQCGTAKPTDEEIKKVVGYMPTGYTTKHFTIPLQTAASSSSVHLGFFKALGVEDRITSVTQNAVGPCWQKVLGCGGLYDATTFKSTEVDGFFTDCNWDGTCTDLNKDAKAIHISASQDTGPLRNAEHLKFVAAFFNKEEVAVSKFASTVTAYKAAAVSSSTNPVVAWISRDKKSQWGPSALKLSAAKYKLKMVLDAGATNVDSAEALANMEKNKMVCNTVDSGTTCTVETDRYASIEEAGAAFFTALGDVDVVIDETYEPDPTKYTLDTFLANYGLKADAALMFLKGKKVLRVDGDISESNQLDWYESRLARPEWALEGLARKIFDDTSRREKYFRNIAVGDEPNVYKADMCKETLPLCNASALASPIPMLQPTVDASNAFGTSFGFPTVLAAALSYTVHVCI